LQTEFNNALKYLGMAQWFIPVIPGTWKVELRMIPVEASPGKKLMRPHFNQ
jgi:hypothetical protein